MFTVERTTESYAPAVAHDAASHKAPVQVPMFVGILCGVGLREAELPKRGAMDSSGTDRR